MICFMISVSIIHEVIFEFSCPLSDRVQSLFSVTNEQILIIFSSYLPKERLEPFQNFVDDRQHFP